MRKEIKLNGKKHVIKTREVYAPKERVVESKKKYNRNAEKKAMRSIIGIY
jgi:hypothetical protein